MKRSLAVSALLVGSLLARAAAADCGYCERKARECRETANRERAVKVQASAHQAAAQAYAEAAAKYDAEYQKCIAGQPNECDKATGGGGGGGGAGGAGSSSSSGQDRVAIPKFPGGNAALPPPVDTSNTSTADEVNQESRRLRASFDASRKANDEAARKAGINASNQQIENLLKLAAALAARLKDPNSIPDASYESPLGRRDRARSGSAGTTPAAPWPPEFSVLSEHAPPRCPPAPDFTKGWKDVTPANMKQQLGITIELQLVQEAAVDPDSADETVRAQITVAGTRRKAVSFGVKILPMEGGGDYVSATVSNTFTHGGTWAARNGPYTPFAPSVDCPRHVRTWQLVDVWAADVDQAYQTFIQQNPQCAASAGGSCYFSPYPQFGQRFVGTPQFAR